MRLYPHDLVISYAAFMDIISRSGPYKVSSCHVDGTNPALNSVGLYHSTGIPRWALWPPHHGVAVETNKATTWDGDKYDPMVWGLSNYALDINVVTLNSIRYDRVTILMLRIYPPYIIHLMIWSYCQLHVCPWSRKPQPTINLNEPVMHLRANQGQLVIYNTTLVLVFSS
jgi:hypothetical protein